MPQGETSLSEQGTTAVPSLTYCGQLLEKAKRALRPGGRLVVCEEFRTRDRLAVQFFWTYFLVGVDVCTSRLREVEWYTEALAALGFVDVRVIPGPFDVVVATRG